MNERAALLRNFPDDAHDLVWAVRTLIVAELHPVKELPYDTWKGIGYHIDTGYVCGIFMPKAGLRVGFENGTDLADPDGWLAGEGAQVRYLPIDRWDEATKSRLRYFLSQLD